MRLDEHLDKKRFYNDSEYVRNALIDIYKTVLTASVGAGKYTLENYECALYPKLIKIKYRYSYLGADLREHIKHGIAVFMYPQFYVDINVEGISSTNNEQLIDDMLQKYFRTLEIVNMAK